MGSRATDKTGRNDRCPCGSGKKYKRCCLDQDEAARRELSAVRPAPQTWAPEREQELDELDVVRVMIGRLKNMLEPGGALGGLRYDAEEFAEAVGLHLQSVMGDDAPSPDDDRSPWERLLDRCYPDLIRGDWKQRAARALDAAEASGKLARLDVIAVVFARSTLALDQGPEAEADSSLLDLALFPIQLSEAGQLQEEFVQTIAELQDDPALRSFDSVEDIELHKPGIVDRLTSMFRSIPMLRGKIERDAQDAVTHALAALQSATPPPLLRIEQYLWAVTISRRALIGSKNGVPKEESRIRLGEAVVNEYLPEVVADWMKMLRDATDADSRSMLADVVVAAKLEPVAVFASLLGNENIEFVWRSDEEQAFFAVDQGEQVDDRVRYGSWLAWLRERGEGQVADEAEAFFEEKARARVEG